MKIATVYLASLIALSAANSACVSTVKSNLSTKNYSQAEQDFKQVQDQFLGQLWQLNPERALYVGYYKYRDQVTIPDQAYRARYLQFCHMMQTKLKQISLGELDTQLQTDYKLIEGFLEQTIWSIESLRPFEWNPSSYNISSAIARLFEAHSLTAEERYLTATKRFGQTDSYYQAARASIHNPTLEHTQLAILQHQNLADYWQREYRQGVQQTKLSEEQQKIFIQQLDLAVLSVNQHLVWLKNLELGLQADGARSFRLPKELYAQKFIYELGSSYTAEEVYAKALAAKEKSHQEMDKLSRKLWPKYFAGIPQPKQRLERIQQLINRLSDQHPEPEEFRQAIAEQIPALEVFVRKHNLVEIDPSKPLVVRDTPVYARGVAGASISAPGPYDKDGETFYNVTPLDAYSDEQARSYLREYNNYTLQILNIHEAIPGHYTQLVYSNRSPSLIKSLFGNGTMVEGWAVYTERMMLEEGYGDHSPELWFMYYKWHLRVILNAILDYEIHNRDLAQDKAIAMLMNEGFQERTEAEQKWRRATLSQVQLASYFTGYTEIYEFREHWKKIKAEDFQIRNFHDQFLSFGSAPIPYIRQMMTKSH